MNKEQLKAIEKLQTVRRQLQSVFVERDSVVDGLLTALIAKQHVLLLGPPGTGKSMLARSLCDVLEGGDFFQYLLTKFSTPEEIFGPVSFKALKEDKYERITVKKLPEATHVFLDEIWKANSSILNSLLTCINERIFFNGVHIINLPLEILIGASNEYPQDSSLDALYDRFMFKFWVDYISDRDQLGNLLDGKIATITKTLTREDLETIRNIQPVWNGSQTKLLLDIKAELQKEGFVASDRMWINCVQAIKAYSILQGHDQVLPSDFRVLADVLWKEHNTRHAIFSIVSKLSDPYGAKAEQIIDLVAASVKKIEQLDIKSSSAAFDKIGEVSDEVKILDNKLKILEKELQDNPNTKITEARETLQKAASKLKEKATELVRM